MNDRHLIFDHVALMSLRMVAVFIITQRRIVAGITSGAAE